MYKIAVVGCGDISGTWIEAAKRRSDCKIAALVDTSGARAETKRELYQLTCNTYTSLDSALGSEDVDLVFDLTPPDCHFNTVTTAMKSGCHVFGEKPMSDSLSDAEDMIRCSDETGKEYFVMQNRRYNPGLFAIRDFLQSSKLGDIRQVSVNFQLNPHFGQYREQMDNPLLIDMAIHTFDALRFILGRNAESVYCHEFNPSWSWYRGNANAVCIFELTGGIVFDYRGSWCANGLVTSWEAEWRVTCANGTLFWDGADKLFYDVNMEGDSEADNSKKYVIEPAPLIKTEHDACLSEMFDALDRGVRAPTDCRDNINSVKMVCKAIESARQKKLIPIR